MVAEVLQLFGVVAVCWLVGRALYWAVRGLTDRSQW